MDVKLTHHSVLTVAHDEDGGRALCGTCSSFPIEQDDPLWVMTWPVALKVSSFAGAASLLLLLSERIALENCMERERWRLACYECRKELCRMAAFAAAVVSAEAASVFGHQHHHRLCETNNTRHLTLSSTKTSPSPHPHPHVLIYLFVSRGRRQGAERQADRVMSNMEETIRKQLLTSNTSPPDEEHESIHWPYCYQIDVLKDDLQQLEEDHHRLVKDFKEKTRAHDLLQRDHGKLLEDHQMMQHLLSQREKLIHDHGLILVNLDAEDENHGHYEDDEDEDSPSCEVTDDQDSGFTNSLAAAKSGGIVAVGTAAALTSKTQVNHNNNHKYNNSNSNSSNNNNNLISGPSLISRDIMELLCSFEGNTLEEKLKCMAEEREDLLREIKSLKLDLDEERQQQDRHGHAVSQSSLIPETPSSNGHASTSTSSPPGTSETELRKLLHEYKFKCKRAEQEIILLQGNAARLETQLSRYKNQCQELEQNEEELKSEKRRILREMREYQGKVDELETVNSNLQKRIHKLQETRIAQMIASPMILTSSATTTTTTAAAATTSSSSPSSNTVTTTSPTAQ